MWYPGYGRGFGWGRGRGFGRGFGWGRGRGFGRGFGWGRGFGRRARWGGNPYTCDRFPWLPRWWWANPDTYGSPYMAYPQYTPQQPIQPTQQLSTAPYPSPPFVQPPTPEQEIEALKVYKAEILEELKGIEARVKELGSANKKKQ